jgi:outer membrane protein assembly factor BamB
VYEAADVIWSLDPYGDGLARGDVTGDGFQDVGIGTKSGEIVLVNGYSGEALWSYRVTTEVGEPMNVDLVDVDGDGHFEVVTAGKGDAESGGKGVILALDGSGTLLWRVTTGYEEVVDLAYGDVDADGDLDVIASVGTYPWGGGQVLVLDASTGAQIWAQSLGNGHARGIDAGDADRDGILKVAVENYDNKVFLLDGLTGSILWSREKDWYGRDVLIAEVDGDGEMEILSGGGQVTAYSPTGVQEWVAAFEHEGFNISASDVNGDFDPEVIVTSAFPGLLAVLDRGGKTLWVRERSGVHAIGDVDGDEILDIVTATISFWGIDPPFSVDALDGDGNLIWSFPLDSILNEGGFGLMTADIDADLAYEVLVANGTQLLALNTSETIP